VNSILLLLDGGAHEIGNPLNSISLQLELLRSLLGEKNSSKALEALEICGQEVAYLHGIIKNSFISCPANCSQLCGCRFAGITPFHHKISSAATG
jgi:hypothetical protein